MTTNNPSAENRFPKIGPLTLALLENAIKPMIGGDAIKIIKEPVEQKALLDNLCKALIRAEKRFISEHSDKDLAEILLSLPLADLPTIRQDFWDFCKTPTSRSLAENIKKNLCFASQSTGEQIEIAVSNYMYILQQEISVADKDSREKLQSLATLEMNAGIERIADGVEHIVKILSQNGPIAFRYTQNGAIETVNETNHLQEVKTNPQVCILFDGSVPRDKTIAEYLVSHLLCTNKITALDMMSSRDGNWIEKTHHDIAGSDIVIPLVSDETVFSELMLYQLNLAYNRKKIIIPTRVQFNRSLPSPLNDYVREKRFLLWNSNEDNEFLAAELKKAVTGELFGLELPDCVMSASKQIFPRPNPAVDAIQAVQTILEHPKGTMDPESRFYISRLQDNIMLQELENDRTVLTIKAPRQMGKSSMLIRGIHQAKTQGKKVIYLDFQRLEEAVLKDPALFYPAFMGWIANKLRIQVDIASLWRESSLGDLMKCTCLMEDYILPAIEKPLVIAMDEVDRMLDAPFGSDFFGMLRSWYNGWFENEQWESFSMLLVISTEPLLLISNLSQSPFNVGTLLALDDFRFEQVADLNQRHGYPFKENQLLELVNWIGGHPYLIRQAMFYVASKQYTAEKLLGTMPGQDGPFADHLRRHLFHLTQYPELGHAMKQVLHHQTSPSEAVTYRLESAGLVKQKGTRVVPRYGLYNSYLQEHLK